MTAAEKKTGHEGIKEYVLDVGERQTTAMPKTSLEQIQIKLAPVFFN